MTLEPAEYARLHTSPLVPLDIQIDLDLFYSAMDEYYYAFRRWGTDHLDKRRYGLPLVNLSGELTDNPDPTIYPLDKWNAGREDKIWDCDFTCATEVLHHPAFDSFNSIKTHMVRSSILKWYEGSLFYPHIDTWLPSPIIRLWGTDCPDRVKLSFNATGERSAYIQRSPGVYDVPENLEQARQNLTPIQGVEAGRLYLIDTTIMHDAQASDEVFQFFIALNTSAKDVIQDAILQTANTPHL